MNVKLWNLINNENDTPKLNVINEIEFEPYGPFEKELDTIPLLCRISKMHQSHVEKIYMATYNHFGDLIGFFHIATGNITRVDMPNRVVATCLLLSGGFSFQLFHNHSVDDLTPSEADKISIYNKKALAVYLEAEYIGDYIISKGGWTNVITGEIYRFDEHDFKFINS